MIAAFYDSMNNVVFLKEHDSEIQFQNVKDFKSHIGGGKTFIIGTGQCNGTQCSFQAYVDVYVESDNPFNWHNQ